VGRGRGAWLPAAGRDHQRRRPTIPHCHRPRAKSAADQRTPRSHRAKAAPASPARRRWPLSWLLLRAIAIGRRREALRDITLAQYRADLDRRLNRVLALPRRGEVAEKLRRRIARDHEHLFVFITEPLA